MAVETRWPFVLALGLTAGCALKGDVRRVELQVEALRVERAGDSQHVPRSIRCVRCSPPSRSDWSRSSLPGAAARRRED